MDGEAILRDLIAQQLEGAALVPESMRAQAGGAIYGFCLGAGAALVKAGLLTHETMQPIMHELGSELEGRGWVTMMSASAESSMTTQAARRDDPDRPPS